LQVLARNWSSLGLNADRGSDARTPGAHANEIALQQLPGGLRTAG
jgi:hypothetical protein